MLCEDSYYVVLWVLKFLDEVIQVFVVSCAFSYGVTSCLFLIGSLPGTVSLHRVGSWAGYRMFCGVCCCGVVSPTSFIRWVFRYI